jgi:hypothetical protein
VSRQLRVLLMIGDNEMIQGVVHRSSEFGLQLRKTPENLSWETVDGGCVTSHRLKWDPFPSNDVGRVAQHVRKGEGRKEAKGRLGTNGSICNPALRYM